MASRTWRRAWWTNDPAVTVCTVSDCGCPIQRAVNGTVEDGLRKHLATVHPESGRVLR